MGQLKGKTGNPNGRTKGTPNRITIEFREFIKELLNENLEQIRDDYKSLEPKDRLLITEKLLSYVLPKLTSTSIMDKPEASTKPVIIFIGEPDPEEGIMEIETN